MFQSLLNMPVPQGTSSRRTETRRLWKKGTLTAVLCKEKMVFGGDDGLHLHTAAGCGLLFQRTLLK
jgi:hypothetical protein